MMKYILTKNVLVQVPIIDLKEKEYALIKRARNILVNGLSMEEIYDLVVSNYLDFEIMLLDSAAHEMIRGEYKYETFHLTKGHCNKWIVNLLTATRMYVDQLSRHVAAALPEHDNAKQEVEQLFSKEYDGCFEYRFMEALRNSVQHFGFPVHRTQFHNEWDGFLEDSNLMFSMNIAALKNELQENDKFNKSVLNEAPDKIDLKKAIRKYVEAISKVHDNARKLVEKSLGESRSTIENTISKYQKEYVGSIAGLFVFCLNDEDEVLDKIPVMLEWDDIRIQLIKRNPLLVNLSRRYVSSKIRPET